jgi:hypothetical protein
VVGEVREAEVGDGEAHAVGGGDSVVDGVRRLAHGQEVALAVVAEVEMMDPSPGLASHTRPHSIPASATVQPSLHVK